MVATLASNGLGYTVGNRRSFDPWGKVRTGALTGDPSGRYCANLGHKQDDDSGYVYMRARYYEPGTGRFISQDPARDGLNRFAYCRNNPISFVDSRGETAESTVGWAIFGLATFLAGLFGGSATMVVLCSSPPAAIVLGLGLILVAGWFDTYTGDLGDRATQFAINSALLLMVAAGPSLSAGFILGSTSIARDAVLTIAAYVTVLSAFLAVTAVTDAMEQLK